MMNNGFYSLLSVVMQPFVFYVANVIGSMFSIYVIENLIEAKYYIGSTNNPNRRREEHFKSSSNKGLKADIIRLGRNNFRFTIIKTGIKTRQEAESIEYASMAAYESDNKIIYNV